MTTKLKLDGHSEVIYFVEAMLRQALSYNASDIHIERYETSNRLRYRLDGVLQEVESDEFMQDNYIGIVSRIKLLAGSDIAEHRLPQDGRFSFDHDNRTVDIRVSVIPLISGERVVLRLLDSGGFIPRLASLGMREEDLNLMKKTLKSNQGMLLVTGPTGSGKTTTLYAGIHEINQPDINILTIEDPVEYKIDGVNQVEVKETIGLDFAHALRAFLRQDPEVMLVGEIRDYETADIAVKAALTGHLVMSTLHTRNITGTIARLINIGLPAYLIGAALNLVVCQRLLRKICQHCKTACVSAPHNLVAEINSKRIAQFYYGSGCKHCRYTGFCGRQAIYEMMAMDDELGHVVANYTASPSEADRQLKTRYTTTLQQAGLALLDQGIVSPEEYLRVLG
ncbi:MAG: type II/IV secretion system protein [Chromatiales bacterium]|nr:type II/IV secretion system protein [Chromatiales bacterium]